MKVVLTEKRKGAARASLLGKLCFTLKKFDDIWPPSGQHSACHADNELSGFEIERALLKRDSSKNTYDLF